MNQLFRAAARPSSWSDARAAGGCFLAACGRANAVPSAVGGVRACRRLPELREVSS